MKSEYRKITLSLGLGALLMGTSAFGALEFTPPETLSNYSPESGEGSAFKTKLVRLGNGLLISIYGDTVPGAPDVYDLKGDEVRKARDVFERHCMPSAENAQCSTPDAWSTAVNISNTAMKTSISTKWEEADNGLLDPTQAATPYYGDSDKPNIFNAGTFAVVSWVDKYCANDATGGAEQRMISYNERGGITVPFSCVYEAHANFADLSNVTWTTTQLTSGIRDAKQDVNKGVSSLDKKGQWVVTWQEDPHGLQIGGGDGPGEGASGANVTHGTDIWYTYTEDLIANGFNNPSYRISDNFTEIGNGGNTSPVFTHDGSTELVDLERGNTGASRANTAMVNITGTETVPTLLVTYEETKGADRLDSGKFIRYHSFAYNNPPANGDVNLPAVNGEPGAIISDPAENSRRVRFVTQVNPATNGLRMGVFWRQGLPVEGGPGDIMVRLGFKTADTSSTGLRPEDMVPSVDTANARESDYFTVLNNLKNTPANNISSNTTPWAAVGQPELAPTNTLADKTDLNAYEDARAHRAAIRGEDFYIGYSYTKDWAVATYTDMDNYNFWVRAYNATTNSWGVAENLSGITEKTTHVKEPRLVGMPGNGPGCTDPANITNQENCQDKSTFLVAWGVETNVYAHVGGSVEGDIYYTRTNDKGVTYTDPSVVEGLGNSNRFESQLRSTPAGNIVFTVWNETNNDAGGGYSGLSTSVTEVTATSDALASSETTLPAGTTILKASGGGCSYNPNAKGFDMIMLFMMALGALYPFRRRFLK